MSEESKKEPTTIQKYLLDAGYVECADKDSEPLPEGKSISLPGGRKYVCRRVLAEGGMGVIYEAEDLDCRRQVALKIIQCADRDQREEVLRFIAEARVASQLEHPNIVPVYDLGFDCEGNVYYTMKYVRGRMLADVLVAIQKGCPDVIDEYPLSRLLTIFQQVCNAVAYAHECGIIHRDIKPANVMLGNFGEVVLMDWGLAKRTGKAEALGDEKNGEGPYGNPWNDETGFMEKTSCDIVVGTPGFMAPEQVNHDYPVGPLTDIYQLGSILYSILALRPPVKGGDVTSKLERIVEGNFPTPFSMNNLSTEELADIPVLDRPFPHCPDGLIPEVLSDIAMKALALNPAARYPSVRSMQREVEAYQNGYIWRCVVDEDFSDDEVASRWEVVGGRQEWRPGSYRINGGEPQLMILRKPVVGDLRIEFDCYQDSIYLNDMACFFCATPQQDTTKTAWSGYEVKYGGYDNSLTAVQRNGYKLWSRPESPLKKDAPYHVVVEKVGSRIRFWVNDQEICCVDDPNPLSGPERHLVGLYGWRASTTYTRVRVFVLQTPWKSDLLDFADRLVQQGTYDVAESIYREVIATPYNSKRMQRAREGLEAVTSARTSREDLARKRKQLEQAWPGCRIQIMPEHDGLVLNIADNGISDLEPLRGMPVCVLNCENNHIQSLEPLRGMMLSSLNCAENPIESLEPLRGMPLSHLICEKCRITNLAPLEGMPLQFLSAGSNPLRSLEPLRGLPINSLFVGCAGINDLAPLRGMPLTMLNCQANEIESLAPLEDMMLGTLNCCGNRIADLSPLVNNPISILHVAHNQVEDLGPLRGMALNMFTCTGNRIRDLSPLAESGLRVLTCANNPLESLNPFVEHPPEIFHYETDHLSDQQLMSARCFWAVQDGEDMHTKEADTLLALRHQECDKLRQLASRFRNHAYLYVPKFLGWDEAKALCERLGGHLLVVHDEEEHRFLEQAFPWSWAWMGLRTTANGLVWVTGEPVDFTLFENGIHERRIGPKVFASIWASQEEDSAMNPFILEWDLDK